MPKPAVRVAVVWNGAVVDEQVVRSGTVTLGSSPRAHLHLPAAGLPAAHPLVKVNGRGAILRTLPSFRGYVGPHGAEVPLERAMNGTKRARLGAGDRALLAVGQVGLYVDVVDQPEKVGREPLADALGLSGSVALLFALSLALHAGFIVLAAIFWRDAPALTIERIPQQYVRAVLKPPPPPRPRAQAPREKDSGDARDASAGAKDDAPKPAPHRSPAVRPKDRVKEEGLLGALSASKSAALSRIFKGGGGTALALANAMGGPGSRAPALAALGAGGGTRGFGTGGDGTTRGHGGLGGISFGGNGRGHGPGGSLAGGKGEAKLGFVFKSGQGAAAGGFLTPDQIDKVVRLNAGGIRYCYEQQLGRFPDMKGAVELEWLIGLSGGVEEASVKSSTLKNGEVEACLVRVVRRWRFPKPQGGKCRVLYPFNFGRMG